MASPYDILGVARDASPEAIRKAYRKLAKAHHPDLHPGDKAAEARFKDIASAYGIVGDETKRALFDSGKIDAAGDEIKPPPPRESYRRQAEAGAGFKYGSQSGGMAFDDDLLAELFGRRRQTNFQGDDINYTLGIDFLEAVNGAKKRVVMGDGRTVDLTIPAGLQDGQTLRLRGQGGPGAGGGEPGDVLVEIHVDPHPLFRREGNNVRSVLPVSLAEALGGAKLPVETVTGVVNLTVPRGSNTGSLLRLRGKGVPAASGKGDHIVELSVVLPKAPDDELIAAVKSWEAKHPYDPRKEQPAVQS